jgi:Holliday junction resolvase RusA-like endonuclease
LAFYFERPKSHTKKQRQSDWHTGKADIDNLQKLVFDALNGIAYDDDKQIAFVTACKRWIGGEADGGIHIILRELQ